MKHGFDTRHKYKMLIFFNSASYFGFKTSLTDMFAYIKIIYYGYFPLDEISV